MKRRDFLKNASMGAAAIATGVAAVKTMDTVPVYFSGKEIERKWSAGSTPNAWWHQSSELPGPYSSGEIQAKMDEAWRSIAKEPKSDLVLVTDDMARELRRNGWIR